VTKQADDCDNIFIEAQTRCKLQ